MRRSTNYAFLLCLVFSITLISASGVAAADFTGHWQGSWVSDDQEDGGYSGSLIGDFVQTGSALTGTLTMTDTGCGNFDDMPLSNGLVVGNNASASVSGYCADPEVAANITVQFTGALAGEVFSGTFAAYNSSTMEGVDTGHFP